MDRPSDTHYHPEEGPQYPATGQIVENQTLRISGCLPFMEELRYIHVASGHIRINDWVMPYDHVTKQSLINMQKSVKAWIERWGNDGIEEVLEGAIERFEERLSDWKPNA